MTDLVIVADDLTGAADSAASLVRRGTTSVVLDPTADWPDADVVAVDTDSRHLDPHRVAERLEPVLRRARAAGAEVVKKIDSTLRGNIVAEMQALRGAFDEAGDRVLLVVAPAFPATGRTTRGGAVHVDGRRLEAHGSDGDVVAVLTGGGLATRLLDRPSAGADQLAAELDALDGTVDAVVVDAEHDEDLAVVVEAARRARRRTLLVGSGGLTRPLGVPAIASDVAASSTGGGGTTLVVVGSYAPAARAQRCRLVETGIPAVHLADPGTTTTSLREALAAGTALLSPDPEAPVVRADAAQVASDLATVVGDVLAEVDTLVATGGETARAVLTAAGVSHLQVRGELEPGVVHLHVPELGLDVVTKAGAFGDEHTLLRCLRGATPRKDIP